MENPVEGMGITCAMSVDKVDNYVDNPEKPVDKMGKGNCTYIVKCRTAASIPAGPMTWKRGSGLTTRGEGAKYTKSRRPVTLVHCEVFGTKEEAMRREYEIKHMSRKEKEKLITQKRT